MSSRERRQALPQDDLSESNARCPPHTSPLALSCAEAVSAMQTCGGSLGSSHEQVRLQNGSGRLQSGSGLRERARFALTRSRASPRTAHRHRQPRYERSTRTLERCCCQPHAAVPSAPDLARRPPSTLHVRCACACCRPAATVWARCAHRAGRAPRSVAKEHFSQREGRAARVIGAGMPASRP